MVGAISFAFPRADAQFPALLLGIQLRKKAGIVMSAAAMVLLLELPFVGQLTTPSKLRLSDRFRLAGTHLAPCFFP